MLYYQLKMKKSDEQGVALIIQSYFRSQDKQQKEQEQKLIKISQIYAKKSWQRRLIHQLYGIFKKLNKKDSFVMLCKRLLRIWDEILENQAKKSSSNGYGIAISEIIVECYTFIFPLIFEYRFHDLILDFKVYRMLWAKYITDEAFHLIRSEIAKSHRNFDLNRGLSADNIDRIKKRFAKKGATEEEIQRYMGITQLQKRTDPSPSVEKRREKESSDEEEPDVMKKRLKQDPSQLYAQNSYSPSGQYNQEQFMYPNTYQKPYPVPQGNPYQGRPSLQPNLPPPAFQAQGANMNLYPPYSRPYPSNFNNMPAHQHQGMHYPMQGVALNPQGYFPEQKPQQFGGYPSDFNGPQSGYGSYNAPQSGYNPTPSNFNPQPSAPAPFIPPHAGFNNYPPNNPNIRQGTSKIPSSSNDYPSNPRDLKRQSPQFTPKINKSSHPQQYYPSDSASGKTDFRATSPEMYAQRAQKEKYKLLLANIRKGLHECKQCGMHFLSKQNLEDHKRDHFLQAQKRFLNKEAETLGNTLGIQKQKPKSQYNFDMLCSINQWILDTSQRDGKAEYQVSIKRLPQEERTLPVFYCYFCNEDLEINWCDQLQEWTINNSVKVHEAERGLCVAHFDCYECFRAEDASFHTTSSLSN